MAFDDEFRAIQDRSLDRELARKSPYFKMAKSSTMRSALGQQGVIATRISEYLRHLFRNSKQIMAAELLLGNSHVLPQAVDLDTKTRILAEFLNAKHPETRDRCWVWPGLLTAGGYGQIIINRKHFKIHRLSFQVYKGEIPPRFSVMHECDVRSCFNPDHLYLGTHAENMADMARKGRSYRALHIPQPKVRLVARISRLPLGKER